MDTATGDAMGTATGDAMDTATGLLVNNGIAAMVGNQNNPAAQHIQDFTGDTPVNRTGTHSLQFVDANWVEGPVNTSIGAQHGDAEVNPVTVIAGIGGGNPFPVQGTDLHVQGHIQEMVGIDAHVNPTGTSATAVAVQHIVQSMLATSENTLTTRIRENGLPVPYRCTKNMLRPMLQHNTLHVLHMFGNIHYGLSCEDRIQAILERERRADMLNEERRMLNKHLVDPNLVLIARPDGTDGLNAGHITLVSSFPLCAFTLSDQYGNACVESYYPLPNGYRNPSDRLTDRVSVAVPDISDIHAAITPPILNNPNGYVYMESSGCSKPLQVLLRPFLI